MGQPKAESDLIFIQILTENIRKLVWASPEQNLFAFHSNSNRKAQEIGLDQPIAVPGIVLDAR